MSSASTNISLLERAQRWLVPVLSKRRVAVFAESHCGPRDENQDNYLTILTDGEINYLQDETLHTDTHPDWPSGWYRLAVADGMGGHAGGREISTRLVSELKNLPVFTDIEKMRAATCALHQRLYTDFSDSEQKKNPGSTLIWADIHISGLVMVTNVGDSRLYHAPKGGDWRLLTHDHHSAEFEWRDDPDTQWSEADLRLVQTNELTQAMGLGSYGLIADEQGFRPRRLSPDIRLDIKADLAPEKNHHADVFSFYLQSGDSLLLASDGLWSEKGQAELNFPLASQLQDKTSFSKAVWDRLALARDNTTALLFTEL